MDGVDGNRRRLLDRLLAKKPVTTEHDSSLKRVLGSFDLTMLGIGAIIGTGIFVLTGQAAAGSDDRLGAGPAIVISFLLAAVACGFAAVCYAELASMIPVAGSAYTYAYASFGQLAAWIIGWDLILEYAVGNVTVAISWSGYLNNLLVACDIHLPAWLRIDPITVSDVLRKPEGYGQEIVELVRLANESAPRVGSYPICFNLPAVLIVFLVTALLYVGVKESAGFNSLLVFLKFAMIALFLWYGIPHVDFSQYWQPFAPNGFKGIMTGASIIFFAYIGFDAVSTASEEAKDPQRSLPIAMIASLIVCTILYVAVALVLTAIAPMAVLKTSKPVADALLQIDAPIAANIISLGAVLSIASVLLVMQLGQTRIFYAMSRDRLLPKFFSEVHPRFGTPHLGTMLTGFVVAIPAGLIDISSAADICSIGTLFAFVVVAIGVLILRYQAPEAHRGFRAPAITFCAPACVISCLALMFYLTVDTWIRFAVWLAIGLAIYFVYGLPRSDPRNNG